MNCRSIHVALLTVSFAMSAALNIVLPQELSADDLQQRLQQYPHKVVFESYDEDNWELFVMNADGSNRKKITNTKNFHELYPQVSPDGSRICFLGDTYQDGIANRSVYLMNADGTERTKIADSARQPCWSPDGSKIAFVKQEFSKFNIADYVSKGMYFYDVKSKQTTEHPNSKIHHLYNLTWAADGNWVLSTVHGGMGFGHAIIAIEVAGDKVIDLKISGCRPCTSPDGKQLTWSSDDHTISAADLVLTTTSAGVENVRVVAQSKKQHLYHPDFSPTGEFITYSSGPGGRVAANGPGTYTQVAEMIGVRGPWDIYAKQADGQGEAVRLTGDAKLANKESEWLPQYSQK
ncbi:MAG: Tol biopolymer transport system component [Pirellulaceae bacterium]|jgi:Tol biopolymer transport system component